MNRRGTHAKEKGDSQGKRSQGKETGALRSKLLWAPGNGLAGKLAIREQACDKGTIATRKKGEIAGTHTNERVQKYGLIVFQKGIGRLFSLSPW